MAEEQGVEPQVILTGIGDMLDAINPRSRTPVIHLRHTGTGKTLALQISGEQVAELARFLLAQAEGAPKVAAAVPVRRDEEVYEEDLNPFGMGQEPFPVGEVDEEGEEMPDGMEENVDEAWWIPGGDPEVIESDMPFSIGEDFEGGAPD